MDFKIDEKSDKKDIEKCFLKDKQKIKYHSFTLLEFFPLEKINDLMMGLDKLYEGDFLTNDPIYNYRDFLMNISTNLFALNFFIPPYIVNSKFFGKTIFSDDVCRDLVDNINCIMFFIQKIMPSLVILRIDVILNENISNKLNDIIYAYPKTNIDTVIGFTSNNILSPEIVKFNEIYELRYLLREEVINYLSQYFKGYFFEQIEKDDNSVIPCVDLFSLKYPTDKYDILNWTRENKDFFDCFGAYMPYTDINYSEADKLILSFEYGSAIKSRYNNYLVFANSNARRNPLPYFPNNKIKIDIDNEIETIISFYSFELFAILRWLGIQEKHVGELNKDISEEYNNISKNKLESLIDKRKKIFNTIFQFQRLKAEYQFYEFNKDERDFHSILDNFAYFHNLKIRINQRIKNIDSLISIITKNSDNILNLTNIESNNRIQKHIRNLTIAILIFTTVQIIILVFGEHLREIINIIFVVIQLIVTLCF